MHRSITVSTWGTVGALAGLYLTDWKVVMGKIPYVRRRFNQD